MPPAHTPHRPRRRLLLPVAFVLGLLGLVPVSHAGQLGTTVPTNCREHTSFSGGADAPGDYRCAGLAIHLHVNGYQHSPFPIWAGQWLFVDEEHQFRVGSCTFNRGVHPHVLGPSAPVAQSFPNDPTGEKRAFLTWRYGDTRDDLTAAALWAVFHWYALDAAGTTRNTNGSAPLIPDLRRVSEMTGNQQLEDLALALDAEAERHRGTFTLSVTAEVDGSVRVSVVVGAQPVSGVPVLVHVAGVDEGTTLVTGLDGTATTTVALVPGVSTVAAVAAVPGPAVVYRGAPASPDPHGAQTLLTGGDPALVTASTTVDVPLPTTTTTTVAPTTTTTTVPSTSTIPPTTTTTTSTTLPLTTTTTTTTIPPTTTTTIPPTTTTTLPPTTVAPTTLLPPTTLPPTTVSPTTTLPPTTLAPTTTLPPVIVETPTTPPPSLPDPQPVPDLPTTGTGTTRIAYLATAVLVGGIGLTGSTRRSDPPGANSKLQRPAVGR